MAEISVLLPSLNVVNYIEQCISSVLNQTFNDIELLCIDAGSTDGTLDVLKRYAKSDSRVVLIESDRRSYGYQMNLGLKRASGEYIGIVETDDFIDADMFETLLNTARITGADVVKANYYSFDQGKNEKIALFADFPYNKVISAKENYKLFRTAPSIWTGIYRKNYLLTNEIYFSETNGASYQDVGFIKKVFAAGGRIVLLDNAYYHYRADNDTSSVHSKEKVYSVCDEYDGLMEYCNGHNIDSKIIAALWESKVEAYLWNYERIDDSYKKEFLQYMQKDFLKASGAEILDKTVYPEKIWRHMQTIMYHPEKYKGYYGCPITEIYYSVEKHGMQYVTQKLLNRIRRK